MNKGIIENKSVADPANKLYEADSYSRRSPLTIRFLPLYTVVRYVIKSLMTIGNSFMINFIERSINLQVRFKWISYNTRTKPNKISKRSSADDEPPTKEVDTCT